MILSAIIFYCFSLILIIPTPTKVRLSFSPLLRIFKNSVNPKIIKQSLMKMGDGES